MNIDFKYVATVLYKNFGDQGIAWVQEQVETHLFDSDASTHQDASADQDATANEDDHFEDTREAGRADYAASYEDEEAFSASVDGRIHNLAAGSIQSPDQVVDVVLELVNMAGEVRKFEEAQVTKRIGIAADRDVAIAAIRAQQELLREYLDRSFDERAENFGKLFDVVDRALETNDLSALAMGLESVIKLADSSPFKDLGSVKETAAALANPEHEWSF